MCPVSLVCWLNEATEQMVLLFDKIVMGFISHVSVGVLPAGETETAFKIM